MKSLHYILLVALILAVGCSNNKGTPASASPWQSKDKVKVLTSIVPVYCLTKMIAMS